jgi:hypothetical protein
MKHNVLDSAEELTSLIAARTKMRLLTMSVARTELRFTGSDGGTFTESRKEGRRVSLQVSDLQQWAESGWLLPLVTQRIREGDIKLQPSLAAKTGGNGRQCIRGKLWE